MSSTGRGRRLGGSGPTEPDRNPISTGHRWGRVDRDRVPADPSSRSGLDAQVARFTRGGPGIARFAHPGQRVEGSQQHPATGKLIAKHPLGGVLDLRDLGRSLRKPRPIGLIDLPGERDRPLHQITLHLVPRAKTPCPRLQTLPILARLVGRPCPRTACLNPQTLPDRPGSSPRRPNNRCLRDDCHDRCLYRGIFKLPILLPRSIGNFRRLPGIFPRILFPKSRQRERTAQGIGFSWCEIWVGFCESGIRDGCGRWFDRWRDRRVCAPRGRARP